MAETSRARLDRLLAKTDRVFREAFEQFVRTVRSKAVMDQISAALERGDESAALEIVRRHVQTMGAAVARAFQHAAEGAAAEALGELAQLGPAVSFAFDPTHPRAAEIMRRETLGLIRDFSSKQIASTRDAMAQGFEEGLGARGKARLIRDSIGLTQSQRQSVQNYRRLLQGLSPEALDRELRDRRSDANVRRAIREQKPLKAAEIDRMTEGYRARFVGYRAETIARTEGVRANSMAREETYRQISESIPLGHNRRMLRVWVSTRDNRTRDAHRAMNGQERPIGQAFIDGDGRALMYPGDPSAPAATTINCRCTLTMKIVPIQ